MNRSFASLTLLIITLITAMTSSANVPERTQTLEPTVNNANSAKLDTVPLYPYFYSILPTFASACDPLGDSQDLLLDPSLIDNIMIKDGLKAPLEANQIKVNTLRHEAREIIVWSLPEPNKATIPLFVAFVPDNGHYRYFTFEYAMNEDFKYGIDYVLGTHDGKMHTSYGFYPYTDNWQEFADIIIKNFYSNPDETEK